MTRAISMSKPGFSPLVSMSKPGLGIQLACPSPEISMSKPGAVCSNRCERRQK
jgi:hypothetical protein